MTEQIKIVYIGTFAMLMLALCLILFVIWATGLLHKQKKEMEKRDLHWISRIENVELLVKSEFHQILTILKDKF